MILPFIGLVAGLFLLIVGTYFIRSKHAKKMPLDGHGSNVDNVDSFVLGILLSIGLFIFCSLTIRQYGYICIAGGLFVLYSVNSVW
ncbi:hypothetical protein A0126_16805 (plasmid) [Exiguobacterium sp. N4-1P]|uniref:hypothetical protein n=1 Tax=Exiguobacterium sp. N4-1P TaxID=2051906 RepID=UPI000B593CBC|nr:hypothetical protein [Exiguobacterium sp. N4-1P]ASI35235.1 hypothetical protein A0126_06530 [Exiguobacterium sp. N4-1P]ASI37248.1 hypothetical protein A0126_16805 [Exiguobacterium sp. N4-1P]